MTATHTPARTRPLPPMYPGGMEIAEEEEQAVLAVLRSKRLFRYYGPEPGPSQVDELEKAFAAHMGAGHALAVTSGTAALLCAVHALGVGPGDEVIIPAYTWISSAAAVVACGGTPVLAEVDESLTIDPAAVEAQITPYTRAIMPVHMRGAPAHMAELCEIARRHGLAVLEDTAQADGGSYGSRRLGTLGDIGCFSLQFNKIITAGEGGMVITGDEALWKRAVMFHDVIGGLRNGWPAGELLWGVNFRMPELLAAVALVQLRRLDGLLAAMRARKNMLKAAVAPALERQGLRFRALNDAGGDTAVALVFFAGDAASAGRIVAALEAENIAANVLYHPDRVDYHIYRHWTPIVEQRTWSAGGGPWRWQRRPYRYHPEMCPRTLDLLGRAVHLDISPLLTNDDVEELAEGLTRAVEAV